MIRIVISFVVLIASMTAHSADFNWSGFYRVEGMRLDNPELNSLRPKKAYILHHLVLQPKIVAADGLTIYGRFDVLNNSDNGPYSQAGDYFGRGPRGSTAVNSTKGQADANVLAEGQSPGLINVTEVYATWTHEFGSLLAGRAPLQFGLGIAHNAGKGMFDHYFDNRDMVGYKVVMGNLSLMPMAGKVNEGDLNNEDDVNDYMMHIQYENPETELEFGLFYQLRIATGDGNDTPQSISSAASGNKRDGYKMQQWGLYTQQKVGDFKIGVEGQLVSGNSGYHTTVDTVKLNSLGLAGEVAYQRERSKWKFGMKLGSATGDDPATQDIYEGFVFDRNYDIGLLMFNHSLGQADFLRTAMVRKRAGAATPPVASQSIDDEGVSNAMYFSPNMQYQVRDNLSVGATFIYAILNKDPIAASGTGKDLGYELDLNVTFQPFERFTWKTEVGALLPGKAWQGGTSGFENRYTYGVSTKAAISF